MFQFPERVKSASRHQRRGDFRKFCLVMVPLFAITLSGVAQSELIVSAGFLSDGERAIIDTHVRAAASVRSELGGKADKYRICTVEVLTPELSAIQDGSARRQFKVTLYSPETRQGAEAMVTLRAGQDPAVTVKPLEWNL